MSMMMLARRGGAVTGGGGGGTVLFSDDFSSGDFTKTQNGISWISTPYASVQSIPTLARTGTYVARYAQGDASDVAPGQGSDGTSELRWSGMSPQTDVYLQWYLYWPNGSESPSVGPDVPTPASSNDKFFRLAGPSNISQVGASTWGGALGLEFRYNSGSSLWSIGEGGPAILEPNRNPNPMIGDAAYKGRWVQVRIRCKVATSANNDGVMQIWIDGTPVHNRTDIPNYAYDYGTSTLEDWYTGGYILGYLNNDVPSGQYTYLADFSISTGGFP